MKFTVIIPTRERPHTLLYSLKTCVTQDYDGLEIIVSDNFSQDNTREVVASYDDPRIHYINTGKRVSMAANWEFALSHVREGYVTFIGDDDGLMPDAVRYSAKLIAKFNPKALIWRKIEYHWPCHPSIPSYMLLPMKNDLVKTSSKLMLSEMVAWREGYNRGPSIYNGFVHADCVNKVKGNSGRFFHSVTPDVYSSFALLSAMDWFLYSTRPFSLNGASAQSNGTMSMTGNGEGDRFRAEMDLPVHDRMDLLPNSLAAAVAEAMLQAKDMCYGESLTISSRAHIREIVKEYSWKSKDIYENGMANIEKLADRLNLTHYTTLCAKRYPSHPMTQRKPSPGLNSHGNLVLYLERFHLDNVFDAGELAGNILGRYNIPQVLTYHRKSYSTRALELTTAVMKRTLRPLIGVLRRSCKRENRLQA